MVQKPETDSPRLKPKAPQMPPPGAFHPMQGGYPGMCTLPRGLPRHQMMSPPSYEPEPPPTGEKPPRPDRPPEFGNKEQRERYWSDTTMCRNTIVHAEPTEKEFVSKQPPGEWPKDEQQQNEAAMNYTPFKTLPRSTPQPEETDGGMSPRKMSEQQKQQGFGNVEANEFVPAHSLPKPGGDEEPRVAQPTVPSVSEAVSRTGGGSRVPSRASSLYSGISIYNTRRMSENSLQQHPVMFQPIAPAWANQQNMLWGRTAYPGDLVYTPYSRAQSQADSDMSHQQIPRVRSSSEMGMRDKSAFIAATLPRKPMMERMSPNKQPMVPIHQPQPQMPPQQAFNHRYQQEAMMLQQQQRNVAFEKSMESSKPPQEKMVPMPVEQPFGGMLRREPVSGTLSRPPQSHERTRDNAQNQQTEYTDSNNNASQGKGKEPLMSQFSPPEPFRAEPVPWTWISRLAIVQVLLGVALFALGIARLVTLATWGLGIELVFGVLVALTGVLGILADRKRHYCSLVAHFVISTMSSCLAIPPFVAALMVTVPDSFTQIDASARKFFTSDNGLISIDIIVAVLCLLVALVSVVIAALGCRAVGRFMERRNEQPQPEIVEHTVEFRKY